MNILSFPIDTARGNLILPTLVLSKRDGSFIGALSNVTNFSFTNSFDDIPQISFTVHKYDNGELTPYWNEVKNLRLLYVVEWDLYFELTLSENEKVSTEKNVVCTELVESELSQLLLHNIEINSEDDLKANNDIDSDKYIPTILYSQDDKKHSLLHRITQDKASNYHISFLDLSYHQKDTYVDKEQRDFSFDDISIYDAFKNIADELNLHFEFRAVRNTVDKKIIRYIDAYTLGSVCMNDNCSYFKEHSGLHRYRGTFDECPICGSTDVYQGYGNDTTIFVNSESLSDELSLDVLTDQIKNVYYLQSNDDLIDATIRNYNPLGNNYIYNFSYEIDNQDTSEDFSKQWNEFYQALYKYMNDENAYSVTGDADLTETFRSYYSIVDEYKSDFADTHRYLTDDFKSKQGYQLNSDIWNLSYATMGTLTYDAIDLYNYIKSERLPSGDLTPLSIANEVKVLNNAFINNGSTDANHVGDTIYITNGALRLSYSGVENTILNVATAIVDARAKVTVKSINAQDNDNNAITADYSGDATTGTADVTFTVTSKTDSTLTADTNLIHLNVKIVGYDYTPISLDALDSISQLLKIKLKQNAQDNNSFASLFNMTTTDIADSDGYVYGKKFTYTLSDNDFKKEINKYSLDALENLNKCCDACIDMLNAQLIDKTWAVSPQSIAYAYFSESSKYIYCMEPNSALSVHLEIIQGHGGGSVQSVSQIGYPTPDGHFRVDDLRQNLVSSDAVNGDSYYTSFNIVNRGAGSDVFTFKLYHIDGWQATYNPITFYVYTGTSQIEAQLQTPLINRKMMIESRIAELNRQLAVISDGTNDSKKTMSGALNYIKGKINREMNLYLANQKEELQSFAREQTYSASYSSDGLSNYQLFQNAKKYVNDAMMKLADADIPKYQISGSVNNVFLIQDYSSIKDKFKIGNWIRVEIDGKVYKLRLLDYTINYDDPAKIDVTFSEAKNVNYSYSGFSGYIMNSQDVQDRKIAYIKRNQGG